MAMTENERREKVEELVPKIMEYLVLARTLSESDKNSSPDFRRANMLAWELAIWLPVELYKMLYPASILNKELLDFLIALRLYVRGRTQEELMPGMIISHAPGIGKSPSKFTQ